MYVVHTKPPRVKAVRGYGHWAAWSVPRTTLNFNVHANKPKEHLSIALGASTTAHCSAVSSVAQASPPLLAIAPRSPTVGPIKG